MLLQNRRIFVIEDNLENRIVTRILLTEQGAKVEFERWGTNAVKALRAFAPIDLIMLDLMFPHGITGYDIFDEIRRWPDFNKVPIVAVSASDPSSAIPRTMEKGFAGFIAKPLNASLLPQQLIKIMNGEKVWHDNYA